MGILGFTELFTKHKVVKLKDLAGMKVAVDSYIEIFRTSGVQHQSGLTNAKGEPTQHIKACFNNIVKAKSVGLEQIWVFDARKARIEKKEVLDDRKDVKQGNMNEIAKLDAELIALRDLMKRMTVDDLKSIDPNFETTLATKQANLEKLKSRNPEFKHICKFRSDIKFMLDKLGIPWCTAPDEIDAEQYGAWLCEMKLANGVLTTDPDALMFGAPFIIKKIPKQTGKYEKWDLQECLDEHKLTRNQFIEVGVALKCDFAPKVAGVGPKTVVKKVQSGTIAWTDAQKRAIEIFKQQPMKDHIPVFTTNKCTTESLQELKNWLVKEQQFGEAGVDKQLAEFQGKL